MAITAMGLGSKSLSGDYNLDPQDQFWSWLHGMAKDHSKGTIFSGFKVEPTDPAGMSVQVGGHALTPDSAVYYGDGTDGNFFSRHNVLFSSDGVPTKVELSGASTSGTTTYYIVSYVMPASSVAASSQTAGTPELVKTIAVTGAGYGAPTASEIEAAKASGAEPGYIIWGQVSISEKTTTVTSSNITQANDMSGGNMRTSRGLLYDDSLSKNVIVINSITKPIDGVLATIPASRLDVDAYYLVTAGFGANFNNTGQNVLECIGFLNMSTVHMVASTVARNAWNQGWSIAVIDKPSPTDGIVWEGSASLQAYKNTQTDWRSTYLMAMKLGF